MELGRYAPLYEKGILNPVFFYYVAYPPPKSEDFMPPTAEQIAKGAESIPAIHGSSGPVHSAFSHGMYGGPQQPAFLASAMNASGVVHCPDLSAGEPNCVTMTPCVCRVVLSGARC